MENRAKPDQSFRIDDLMNGKISKDQFQISYLPMWNMLDSLDRKAGGLQSLKLEDVFKRIYEFAIIQVSLEKSDFQTRVDELNEANLRLFIEKDNLQKEVAVLRTRIEELVQQKAQGITLPTETTT